MAKIEPYKLSSEERQMLRAELRSCLLHLPKKKDIVDFLFDLLSPSEQVMITRRILIARRLLAGKSHQEIRYELHVGFDTIHIVHGWLEEKFENYRSVLPPLFKEKKQKSGKEKQQKHPIPIDAHSFRGLRKRYPMHFLLFNLLLGNPQEYEVDIS